MQNISTPAISRRDGSLTPGASDSSYMNEGNNRVGGGFEKKYHFHDRNVIKKNKIERHNTLIGN